MTPNKSLDTSGGSVFRNLIHPAKVREFAPPRQLNRSTAHWQRHIRGGGSLIFEGEFLAGRTVAHQTACVIGFLFYVGVV